MNILRLVLIPLMLFILVTAGVGTFVLYETARNEFLWERTVATVERTDVRCEVSYRPVIRKIVAGIVPCAQAHTVELPADAQNVKITRGLLGVITYDVQGRQQRFEGMLKDAGIYADDLTPGQQLVIAYDPKDPSHTDLAEYKGWKGFVLILAGSYSLIAAYIWFFWLRRKPPSKPDSGFRQPAARSTPASASANRPFGRASRT